MTKVYTNLPEAMYQFQLCESLLQWHRTLLAIDHSQTKVSAAEVYLAVNCHVTRQWNGRTPPLPAP